MIVRVTAASKYGATREIAAAIANELGRAHTVELPDAEVVKDFGGAEAVVLGSAAYAGHRLRPAQALLEGHATELASRPTWLFSSGPIGDPPKPADAEPVGVAEAVEAIGARGHEGLAGKLDRSKLTPPERLLPSALRAPEGDFRDWDAIRGWARRIADELGG